MPRDAILKASTAARRAVPHARCFDLSKQPTVIERVAAQIFELVVNCGQEAAVINVLADDVANPITESASILGDENMLELQRTIPQALASLAAKGYIEYCVEVEDTAGRFRITPDFQAIIQDLIQKLATTSTNSQHYNIVERHRFNCCFFRMKFKNFKRPLTRRELDLENRRLKAQADERSRSMGQTRSASVATEETKNVNQEPNSCQNNTGSSGSSIKQSKQRQ